MLTIVAVGSFLLAAGILLTEGVRNRSFGLCSAGTLALGVIVIVTLSI